MNAKIAKVAMSMNWVFRDCDGKTPDEVRGEAQGFLEATKSAEPLLEQVIRLYQALNQFIEPYLEQACEHGKLKREADICLGKEALSSSASVVATYRREVLGE